MAADCVTLWIGESLGRVERACLRSVLRQGHSLALYCYRRPRGVPEGIEVRDASEVLPEHEIFFQRGDSVAGFSDWFRYELQREGAGIWVDTDVYLLRRLDTRAAYLLGEEAPGIVNNAVFRTPPNSPILHALLEIFEARTTPRWLPWRAYLPAVARKLIGGTLAFSKLPWGATGPMALAKLVREFGLEEHVQPPETFNPVPWSKARWILDPEVAIDDVTTDRTIAVHLWNHCISAFKEAPTKKGSFLERLQLEGE